MPTPAPNSPAGFDVQLGRRVGFIASCVLLTQVFALTFLTNFFIYFFELMICFTMTFVLGIGIRQKKSGYVTAYALFLSMYVFWVTFGMIFFIWWYAYVGHLPECPTPPPLGVTTPKYDGPECEDGYFTTGDTVALVLCIISCLISIAISLVQIRLLFLLFRSISMERSLRRFNVSYQTQLNTPVVQNAPPRYTATTPGGQPAGNNGTQAGPLPEKPPVYMAETPAAPVSTLNPPDLLNLPPNNQSEAADTVPVTPPTYRESEQQHNTVVLPVEHRERSDGTFSTIQPSEVSYTTDRHQEFFPSSGNPFAQDVARHNDTLQQHAAGFEDTAQSGHFDRFVNSEQLQQQKCAENPMQTIDWQRNEVLQQQVQQDSNWMQNGQLQQHSADLDGSNSQIQQPGDFVTSSMQSVDLQKNEPLQPQEQQDSIFVNNGNQQEQNDLQNQSSTNLESSSNHEHLQQQSEHEQKMDQNPGFENIALDENVEKTAANTHDLLN